jgi:hypothetical protein
MMSAVWELVHDFLNLRAEWRVRGGSDEQFVELTNSTFDESQKMTKSTPANTLEHPVESRNGRREEN